MKKIILTLLVAPLLATCSQNQEKENENFIYQDIEITYHNYYEIADFEITWSHIFEVQKEEFFVYFYSTTCSHCAELKDLIIEEALKRENIYFVKSSENDNIQKDVSSTIGAKSCESLAILGYPTLIKIVNGIVTDNAPGKSNIKKLLNL